MEDLIYLGVDYVAYLPKSLFFYWIYSSFITGYLFFFPIDIAFLIIKSNTCHEFDCCISSTNLVAHFFVVMLCWFIISHLLKFFCFMSLLDSGFFYDTSICVCELFESFAISLLLSCAYDFLYHIQWRNFQFVISSIPIRYQRLFSLQNVLLDCSGEINWKNICPCYESWKDTMNC